MSVASSIYAIDHPKYIVSNQKIDSVGAYRVVLLLINCLLLFIALWEAFSSLFCCAVLFCNHLAGEDRDGCSSLQLLLMSCDLDLI